MGPAKIGKRLSGSLPAYFFQTPPFAALRQTSAGGVAHVCRPKRSRIDTSMLTGCEKPLFELQDVGSLYKNERSARHLPQPPSCPARP